MEVVFVQYPVVWDKRLGVDMDIAAEVEMKMDMETEVDMDMEADMEMETKAEVDMEMDNITHYTLVGNSLNQY